ncbi:aspartic peptidase domain-containing protein [Massariosphaeria phaeospora]|uniref:Aspartic peptidase domain-containing protein n=1 Tax=Massariosphaeria phaeospora TaxID=100035 RepID=A0A7C8MBJ6_9PLEO|nr:aspartic peptidase domain-containing protein [Massariosphaeria phaeospora]
MASLVFYLSATVLLAQSTVAFNCSKPPIYVDIHKRAVHDSPEFQYGSFIGVGTPAQNQSLWPSLSQNHTSFGTHAYCGDNSTLRNCDRSTGGFFLNQQSTYADNGKDFQSLDQSRNETALKGSFGQDTLRLYTHYFETDGASQTLLENSTVELAESGSIAPGIVGLGASSTVLRDLAAKDLIAGRTYSLYIGQGYARAGGAVNGSNTFGGYDSGRFTGTVHKYAMKTENMNPMSLRVKDIIISNSKDTNANVSLFDNAKFPDMKSRPEAFEAAITTNQFPLSLPYQITQNFMKHLGAEKDNTWGDNSLKLKDHFSGTLSIVLEDDFVVTLPSEVLVNNSNITPIQDREEKSDAPFYLSAAFLSQVYLMADYESNNFFLAEAIQKDNMVMPVTFCPKSTPEPYQRPKQSAWVSQGLIGAVIGGLLGGAGIAVCAYCFVLACRRKRAERKLNKDAKKSKMMQLEIEETPEFDPPPKSATPFFWKKR